VNCAGLEAKRKDGGAKVKGNDLGGKKVNDWERKNADPLGVGEDKEDGKKGWTQKRIGIRRLGGMGRKEKKNNYYPC